MKAAHFIIEETKKTSAQILDHLKKKNSKP